MSLPIDHVLLDAFERTKGDPALLPKDHGIDPDRWDLVEAMLLDLHLIRHGYADDAYARHIERRLRQVCVDESVAVRLKGLVI